VIRMENVSFHYADCEQGVKDINLTIHDGECVVLTGPSGGGKTTLTRLLNGLAPAYYTGSMEGHIFLDDTPLETLPQYAVGRRVGSVFQDPKSQFFSSELAGEVAFACENYGMAREEVRSRTDAAIQTFSLEHLRGRSLDVLSSGEKQRVAIASVYALRPGVYVCDEPTANLDGEGSEQLAETLKKLKAEGCTLVIAEHRLAWLSGIADRFLYLDGGRILWEKSPVEMAHMSEGERETYGLREVTQSPFPDLPQPESGDVFIRTEDLSCKRKGNLIFHHLSLSVCAGQVTAVTGRNGAGKTSLAMALSGLWKESGGSVLIGGENCAPQGAAGGLGTAPTIPAHSFLRTASQRNCCWVTTTRRPGWNRPEAF
jgi:energy-coupling factor transporter ATP-binding protein EcfA2